MTFTLDIDQLTLADALHLVSPTPLSTETHGALLPALLAELPPITTDAAYDFPAAMEDLNVQLLRTHTAENMDLSSGDTLDSYTPFASAAGEIQIELFGEFSAGDWTVDLYLDADTTPTLSQIVTLPAGTSDYRLLTRPIALGPADSVRVDLTNIAATDNSYTVRWFDRTPATVADLQTALDAQGYSATRAATLDNLDAPVTAAKLAADGLDSISTTLTAKPASFREQLVWLFHRFASKLAFVRTGQTETTQSAELTVYNELDAAVTTQSVTDDALRQDVAAAETPGA